jgi:hypothetical protein
MNKLIYVRGYEEGQIKMTSSDYTTIFATPVLRWRKRFLNVL